MQEGQELCAAGRRVCAEAAEQRAARNATGNGSPGAAYAAMPDYDLADVALCVQRKASC
ncbi:MAG: hypothetical protein IPN95_19580 [Bacteroidetes bacterium]|nr:hypothetical protein [Bacteroidota bacterium]